MEKGTKNNEFVRKIREILISDQKWWVLLFVKVESFWEKLPTKFLLSTPQIFQKKPGYQVIIYWCPFKRLFIETHFARSLQITNVQTSSSIFREVDFGDLLPFTGRSSWLLQQVWPKCTWNSYAQKPTWRGYRYRRRQLPFASMSNRTYSKTRSLLEFPARWIRTKRNLRVLYFSLEEVSLAWMLFNK